MRSIITIICIITVLAILVMYIPVPALANEDSEVIIDVPAEGEPGSNVSVSIDVTGVSELNATQYDIRFDPAVLRLDSITDGMIGSQVISVPTGAIAPQEIAPGHWRVVQSLGLSSVSGSGNLAILHFEIIGPSGATSDITVTDGIISGMQGEISATWTGGNINVASVESDIEPSPTPDDPSPSVPPSTPSTPSDSTPPPSSISIPDDSGPSGDDNGLFKKKLTIQSLNKKAKINVNEGTIGYTKENTPLTETAITITEIPQPSPLPEDSLIIGPVYDFQPGGAAFLPAITISLDYNATEIPPDYDERELTIAYWNDEINEWICLDSIVDYETNTISTSVSHFTAFTILAYKNTPPAAIFTITDLNVSPASVDIGNPVTVSALVTNHGGLDGQYQADLEVDGLVEEMQAVKLAAGESKIITFTITRDKAGSYLLSVGGLNTSLTVTDTSSIAEVSLSEVQDDSGKINWTTLYIFIGGIVFIIGLVLIIRNMRRLR